jgi:hypothetical protein
VRPPDAQARPEVLAAVDPYRVALGRDVRSPNARAALATLGGDPLVTELVTGAPAVRERYLSYPSGAEVLVRDGVVTAFWFHTEPSLVSPDGFDPARLLPGLPRDPDWDDIKAVAGTPRRLMFTAGRERSADAFAVRDASLYVTLRSVEGAGYRGVERLLVRPAEINQPVRPLADMCSVCADLAVCDESGSMAVDETLDELAARVGDGRLADDPYRVRLRDVRDLRASGLMECIEVHLDCSVCRTTWCLRLPRTGEPTLTDVAGFGYQHPKLAVPPVEQWAGAGRLAEAAASMKVIDWAEGGWFLLEKQGQLYLDVHCGGGHADYSVFVSLDDAQRAAYERDGREAISSLARAIDDSGPLRPESPWYARDLSRREHGKPLRDEETSAIGGWVQQQRWNPGAGGKDVRHRGDA